MKEEEESKGEETGPGVGGEDEGRRKEKEVVSGYAGKTGEGRAIYLPAPV